MRYAMKHLYILLIMLTSCASSHVESIYTKDNKIDKETSVFSNEKLKVSVDFFDDYSGSSSIDRKDYRMYKHLLKEYFPELKVREKNFLFTSYTVLPPYNVNALFSFPSKHPFPNRTVYDSINGCIAYTIEGKERVYIHTFCLRQGQDYDWLKRETEQVVATYLLDEHYNNWDRPVHANPFTLANEYFKDTTNYLSPVLALKDVGYQYSSREERWSYLQAALTYGSFLQNNPMYNELRSELYKAAPPIKDSLLFADSLAMDYLVRSTCDKQVVMLNEAHWEPKGRYLCNLLLDTLYRCGFRYLAVEALGEEDTLNQQKFPVQSSGFYTRDPIFGNMLRNALQLGYTVVSYDDGSADRERMQAENIYRKTILKDSLAKVLVYAGHGHIRKDSASNSSRLMMAYYFQKMTGIVPFTINQTRFEGNENSPQLAIWDSKDPNFDIVLTNNYVYPQIMYLPKDKTTRYDVPISDFIQSKLKWHGTLLLMVYVREEFEKYGFDAIPVLNYSFSDSQPIKLDLPTNSYVFIIRSPTGFVLQQFWHFLN